MADLRPVLSAKKKPSGRLVAVTALLSGATVAGAAAAAGVSTRTLLRWRQQESFQALYRTEAGRIFTATRGRIRALSARAAEILAAALEDRATQLQLKAVRTVFDVAQAADLDALAARIEALEAQGPGGEGHAQFAATH